MNRTLHAELILPNVKTLCNRIHERFPNRSLSKVCTELYQAALESQEQARKIARPNIPLRVAIGFLIVMLIVVSTTALFNIDFSFESLSLLDVVTLFESTINDFIFIGAGIYFLVSIENRIKRRLSLKELNELRAMAHIIDMHQLTKEPEGLLKRGKDTKSSPKRDLNAFELSRYLDYCSEMLSIIGKIAVIYVEHFDDQVVLKTVNEIEALTNGLSRKIWQKLMIIHQLEEDHKVNS